MIPPTMQYVAYTVGGPETLAIATGPTPTPASGEVLIAVQAAGVNRPDVAQRRGAYPPPADASPILGLEVAGTVVAVGSGAIGSGATGDGAGWMVGDRVCALTNGGGYAEYAVAPGSQCLRWPAGFTAVQAAALPETYFTVWANLFMIGGLTAGESVLIHGGSSGIGTTAIQLAKALGARVYVTAGSADKCEACIALGADGAINYREADFVDSVHAFTNGAGVNVVLDMVGAPYFQQNLRCLAMDGRLVLIAFLGGAKAPVDLTTIMTRRLHVTGSTMRPRTAVQKAAIAAELRDRVWPLLDAGRCRPVVFATFPLDQAAAAHALMEGSTHVGKIMLEVS